MRFAQRLNYMGGICDCCFVKWYFNMNNLSDSGHVVTVGLLWHSVNSANLGIGALTASNVAIVEKVARENNWKVRFKIMGWLDPEPSYIQADNIEIFPMRGRDLLLPGGLYKALCDCDLVFDISAGDSFADIYGTRRFVFNVLAKFNVFLSRRPLILSPQTVGPFTRWWSKLLAGILMKSARHVVTRDYLSTDFLKSYKLGNRVSEATDVAFRLPFNLIKQDGEHINIGLNVSGLLFNGGYTKDNMFSLETDYPTLVRALLSRFVEIKNCKVHLIGHVNSLTQQVEDDYRVASFLASEFPGTILAPRFENPSAAKSYIATMDFFAGARMHACIAAFSSGVPVLPMAYSRKFEGLFGTLGYKHLADCRTQTNDEIIGVVMKAFKERSTLKSDVDICRQRAEKKLEVYEDIIADTFRELA